MKSINEIFKNNTALKDEPEVQELIDYCRDLEDQVIDTKQTKQFSSESELTVLVREIYGSLKDVQKEQMEHERWGFDAPDYKQSIQNLHDYLLQFSKDYNFRLK